MNERLAYEYSSGYSGGFIQMAPWRSKNCGIDGCTFLYLKIGDYWAIFMLFDGTFKLNLKQFGKETTSDRFSKQIPAMYSKITGNKPPGYLLADIK